MKLPLHTILLGAVFVSVPQLAHAVTVTNTADSGTGTLRAAINAANATPGTTINFNIPTTDANYNVTLGVAIIRPTTALPTITANGTVIDGTSQTTFLSNPNPNGPEVTLSGQLMTTGTIHGIEICSSNSVVKGLTINGFTGDGIYIHDPDFNAANVSSNTVKGCYIGVNAATTNVIANFSGIEVDCATSTLIGGTTTADRNIISGNPFAGVVISRAPGSLVRGNYIGCDRTASTSLPNGTGVLVSAIPTGSTTVVGGTDSGAGNIISGNANGVALGNAAGTVRVEGNYVGTTASGNTLLAVGSGYSQNVGILVDSSNGLVTIGGTTDAARNVIGGNTFGILLDGGTQINVTGNYIGVGADGATDIGNESLGIGVFATSTSPVTATIGGTGAGSANKIAFNGVLGGVSIEQSDYASTYAAISVRGNSIYSNDGLGINLISPYTGSDVTANDSGDSDSGPNGLQNFPVLSSAVGSGSGTLITGTLNSTPSTSFNVDFYRSTVLDPSGYGEGRVYLGSQSVTTNASGNATISFNGPTGIVGQCITTTASRGGMTSEFSGGIEVTAASFKIAAPSGKGS